MGSNNAWHSGSADLWPPTVDTPQEAPVAGAGSPRGGGRGATLTSQSLRAGLLQGTWGPPLAEGMKSFMFSALNRD